MNAYQNCWFKSKCSAAARNCTVIYTGTQPDALKWSLVSQNCIKEGQKMHRKDQLDHQNLAQKEEFTHQKMAQEGLDHQNLHQKEGSDHQKLH